MRAITAAAALAVASVGVFGPGGADALPVPTVVTAVPINTYAPELVVTSSTGGLDFHNLDLNQHDVVAELEDETGALREDHVRPHDSAPWCEHYEEDDPCPLFWTDLISTGETVRVEGLEDAVPGTTYFFYCSIHPYMQGELVVLD